jgi:SNF2 family DNA or RNA helicase
LVWSELNDESKALTNAIDGAVEITGSMDIDDKEEAMRRFISGDARVLVSKPSLCGHGVNLQHCNKVAFVGITDSFEQQFQAIGRVHRFGQKRPVDVHFFLGEMEIRILENVRRKAADAVSMGDALAAETRDAVRAEVLGSKRVMNDYDPTSKVAIPAWLVGEQ